MNNNNRDQLLGMLWFLLDLQTLIGQANCKLLYGADTDVFTILHTGRFFQAVAMRSETYTDSWTKFLHSKEHTESRDSALQQLLEETEAELAKLFSANRIK